MIYNKYLKDWNNDPNKPEKKLGIRVGVAHSILYGGTIGSEKLTYDYWGDGTSLPSFPPLSILFPRHPLFFLSHYFHLILSIKNPNIPIPFPFFPPSSYPNSLLLLLLFYILPLQIPCLIALFIPILPLFPVSPLSPRHSLTVPHSHAGGNSSCSP